MWYIVNIGIKKELKRKHHKMRKFYWNKKIFNNVK